MAGEEDAVYQYVTMVARGYPGHPVRNTGTPVLTSEGLGAQSEYRSDTSPYQVRCRSDKGGGAPLDHLIGDDRPLDLARALPDPLHP